jgi:hypothetical protein
MSSTVTKGLRRRLQKIGAAIPSERVVDHDEAAAEHRNATGAAVISPTTDAG